MPRFTKRLNFSNGKDPAAPAYPVELTVIMSFHPIAAMVGRTGVRVRKSGEGEAIDFSR